ncbi:MAG: STAS domain-containing protein [Spirochaetes bacterium]|nr:STAS domain-containing protein [Spirochaetota bacterium]
MIKNKNTWSFPINIAFEMVPLYVKSFEETSCNRTITFDLSRTKYLHSSFIGFLIDAKQKTEKEGGSLELCISPELEKIFIDKNIIQFLQYTRARKSA